MLQGVRIVFHGNDATPVPALQKPGSQLIALPGCRNRGQYGQHRSSQRVGKAGRAEETRDRTRRGALVLKGRRTDSRPVRGEKFSFDPNKVGTEIWGLVSDERDPTRFPER
jgi:hypothetical protein